jgi:hypothetical protein
MKLVVLSVAKKREPLWTKSSWAFESQGIAAAAAADRTPWTAVVVSINKKLGWIAFTCTRW